MLSLRLLLCGVCLILCSTPRDAFAQFIFSDASIEAGVDSPVSNSGVSWGDFDGDGYEDILVSGITLDQPPEKKPLTLYRNLRDGRFEDVSAAAGLTSLSNWYHAIWGDYDNDGDLDIYASVSLVGERNHLYRNDGNGTFSEVGADAGVDDSRLSRGIAWGDYNNDGHLDIYVANGFNDENRLYRNNGDGSFTDVASQAGVADGGQGQAAVWEDFDQDGDADLFLTDSDASMKLYNNNGNGTFTNIASAVGLGGNSMIHGVALGDYDNDQDLDVYLCDMGAGRLYRNNGNTSFTIITNPFGGVVPQYSGDAAWADVDNDGWLDLYVVSQTGQDMLYRNNGNTTFTDLRAQAGINGLGKWFGVGFGDYDNDGDLDLYAPVISGSDRLYRNESSSNGWLHVKLVGGLSNRSAIGAKVVAVTGLRRQIRTVDGGSGLFAQGSLPVEFGVGNSSMVDSVIVLWPSGTVQNLTRIEANQRITITEATTTSSTLSFTEVGNSAGVGDGGPGRGTAWGDYDMDGDQDLFLVNSGQRNRLYRSDGISPGTDLAVAAGVADGGSGFGAAWGDYDNDGDHDLYLARSGQQNLLYRNNSGTGFTEVGAGAGVADSDEGRSVAWGDYDRDGHLDLYVVNDGPNRLYHNNGDGTFTENAATAGVNDNQAGQGAAWGDYDGDGFLDLYLSNGRSGFGFSEAPNRLYRNNRDGSFSEVGGFARVNDNGNGRGVAWGDYDSDGDLDLFLANSDETLAIGAAPNRLYRNDGDGKFSEVATVSNVNDSGDGQGVAWVDYDNDGHLDLSVINDGANQLYRNDGAGGFIRSALNAGVNDGGNGTGGTWGDMDKDGWLDFYVVNDNEPNRLYRNEGNGNRWLSATLEGALSNKSGIGAQVVAVSGNHRQRSDVDGGSGYLSQPSLPVEFGFGSAVTIDSLVVHWPSGQRQVLTSVATNQHITISESDIPDDIVPPVIAFGTQISAIEGQPISISAEVSDAIGIRDVWMLYRTAGFPVWSDSIAMERETGSNVYRATIPGARVSPQGVEYVIGARDPSGNVALSIEKRLFIRLGTLFSVGLNLPSGTDLAADDFRMISIPALLTNPDPPDVLGESLGTTGAYNTRSWRLFRWNGAQYKEHPNAGQMTPGKAFWVIARDPKQIELENAFSSADQIRSIVLTPGWNQVGTPYLFPIPVSDLIASNPGGFIEPIVWEWTGSSYVQATELKPWHGYWVQNLASGSVPLVMPFVDASRITAPKHVAAASPNDEGWSLQIAAKSGALVDDSNYVGVAPGAQDGYDAFDISEPPTMGEGAVSLAIVQDQSSSRPGRYSADFKPATGMGSEWYFTVTSGSPSDGVELSISNTERIPPDIEIQLIDLDRQEHQNVRTAAEYLYLPAEEGAIRHFLLVAGPSSFVSNAIDKATQPVVVNLRQNVPNPFNPTTLISFDLPAPASVTLTIYNILGQEVRRLLDEVRPPGRHAVSWHGLNDRGRAVASGLYIYQLRTGSALLTRKMLLLR